MDTVLILGGLLGIIIGIVTLIQATTKHRKKKPSFILVAASIAAVLSGSGLLNTENLQSIAPKDNPNTTAASTTLQSGASEEKSSSNQREDEGATEEKSASPLQSDAKLTALKQELAQLNYAGKQTIEINQGKPTFSKAELATTSGAWEKYYPLDALNRATGAEALLNQSLMPKEKRGSISSVTPTGWRNKKIGGSYLYNRSHLIGFALAGENANWQNLITGTRQLNNPEMLRFEMDIKYYLEQDKNHFVRYEVTPIFRNDELLARGVHLMAQSVNSEAIKFNVYIFNVQDNVKLNYADGTSQILKSGNSAEK
ncbi:DNA/RNA non-specific endonuclease [Enterococcus sp. MJM12]|uniref:DNA/RNA non-specific endonuclease n=1 Tax=Candidatus Enterococcus myersii TaxID=2815322 RepID=A0ABS3H4U4_9ENTE|nr:DNA/RNA non-specific endonuclease [Enterococcus sp. MJM12]MCD1025021.1 DNA/RNA non-specific endonuclease [Enterococcus sp. SMC-9]